ncbi:FMN-binding glutamate synthase family protein [Heliorestis acidaminivorans]|uniref:FMN-binding glutamate synthase family protein n=1 Tax=Heliorestis acidaminivorans TaxID=553427 RepID=A0A6I0EYI2_9FIRM|nr:FMN-binding glutamate synthase family protein [Heliorestis acidaminivorans]KAB2951803.1 FMN-binding glutamate synthase family protein [Heliorestis acidaminivorans]
MTFSRPNRSEAILARNRTPNSITTISGLCATCSRECPGLCEVAKAAYRGKEVLYPQPFGAITAGSEKVYPIDYSHFNVMGTAVGAWGIPEDSDQAIFPNVSTSTSIGATLNKISLDMPLVVAGMGSTKIAADFWAGMATGAAITGTGIVIGENVCGMDPELEVKNGRVVRSPDLERRIRDFLDYDEGKGFIAVQANVEDTKLGVQEYAIEKLGVTTVELKWGQGAKNIGGEVKLNSLERALQLKSRGYVVLPDPEDPDVQKAYKKGAFKEFERHSRVGMVTEESFHRRVEELRQAGAQYIFLKTGAYRPADLARAIRFASDAKLDLLTIDGAGGGTGMSPWRMMNEWGIPVVEIHSLTYQYAHKLKMMGKYVPAIAFAGGFSSEDMILKGLALGAPYTKMIGLSRPAVIASFVGQNIYDALKAGKEIKAYSTYGQTVEEVFIYATELQQRFGKDFDKLPPGAIGMYSYYQKLKQGMQQFLCGLRKFSLDYVSRDDIAALTPKAAKISGIPYIMEVDKEEAEKILTR